MVGRVHAGVNLDSHGCLLFVLPVPTNAPGELTSFRKYDLVRRRPPRAARSLSFELPRPSPFNKSSAWKASSRHLLAWRFSKTVPPDRSRQRGACGIGHEAVMLRSTVFRPAGLHGGILPVVGCAHPGIDGAMNLEPPI